MSTENKNTQAQAQAQETTTVVTTGKASLDVMTEQATLERLGYTDNRKFKIDDLDGEKVLTIAVGSDVEMTVDTATAENIASVDALAKMQNFDGLAPLYKAFYASQLIGMNDSTTYKTLGDMLADCVNGLDPKTVNKYAKIGKAFLKADENGQPVWKDPTRFKGAQISNISQCWRIIETVCKGDLEQFYKTYVKTGILPIKGTQADVKKGMESLDKDGNVMTEEQIEAKKANKGKGKDKDTVKPNTNKENPYTPETHLRMALDALLAKIPADNNKAQERAKKDYNDMLQMMIDFGLIPAPEQAHGQEKDRKKDK